MIEWVAQWIGSDVPSPDDPNELLSFERRNIKRSVVCAINEQCIQMYCNGDECTCGSLDPDCACFTTTNRRVPNRVSEIHLMAYRLDFANNNTNSKSGEELRMRTTRLYWMQSQDMVIQRNAQLLKLKTKDWGERADRALTKLANLLDFDVIAQHNSAQKIDIFNDDSDDEVAVEFGSVRIASTQDPTRKDHYNPLDASIQSEIKKFLKQHPEHYIECKFLLFLIDAQNGFI